MEKTGQVVGLHGSKAQIEIKRMSECGDKCTTCAGGCDTPSIIVEVENRMHAERGDFVVLEAPESAVMKSSFLLYTIPLIDFVVGVVVGMKFLAGVLPVDPELTGILTGFVFLGLSYVAIAFMKKQSGEILRMQSVLKKL
jgi:sigma-E factor negative regulatory protein RseC